MKRLAILLLLLLLSFSHELVAQTDSVSNRQFSGMVLDDSLGTVLPFVHIWNESTRQGGFSNDTGVFNIKIKDQDTLVFNTLGYRTEVVVVSPSSFGQHALIRLKPKYYEIGEVVVRRFRSYESFKYEVLNRDLPESKAAQSKEYINLTAAAIAIEADRERAIKDKMETGRFGYTTQLGRGIDREKAFKAKIADQKKREEVIAAKFNRALVEDLTKLEGDELTKFIGYCNFSEEYLYETDLYAIIEDMYALLDDYQNSLDSIPPVNRR